MIDSHAHLDDRQFDGDRDRVIDRARAAGVNAIISVATDLDSSLKTVDLAEKSDCIRAAVGFYPDQAKKVSEEDISRLAEIAVNPAVVAIGEIGLNYYHDSLFRKEQLRLLEWQLELAGKLKLPVILHCRRAEKDLLPLLRKRVAETGFTSEKIVGVIHCFSGDTATANAYFDLGFLVSLGAYIGYPSSRQLAEVIRALPSDRLLLETDCPWLPPQSRRGQRNEPGYLPETARTLAEIRGVPVATIDRATSENASRLFGLSQQ